MKRQRSDATVDYQAFRNENGGYNCTCITCGKVDNVSKQTLYRRHRDGAECRSCAQKRTYPNRKGFHIAQKAYAKSMILPAPLDRPHRQDLAKWAAQVHKNWNYTCAMCGSGKKLEAHHIIPRCYSPENTLVVENGITLCPQCHKDLHEHLGAIRRPKEI